MTDEKLISWANLFKKVGNVILYMVAVGLLLGLIITIFIGKPSEIKATFKANKQIEKGIDSLKKDNQFITSRMFEFEKNQLAFYDAISKNNALLEQNNSKITKLQKIYNEKITNINTYNISQLDSFFTSRYKDYYNR